MNHKLNMILTIWEDFGTCNISNSSRSIIASLSFPWVYYLVCQDISAFFSYSSTIVIKWKWSSALQPPVLSLLLTQKRLFISCSHRSFIRSCCNLNISFNLDYLSKFILVEYCVSWSCRFCSKDSLMILMPEQSIVAELSGTISWISAILVAEVKVFKFIFLSCSSRFLASSCNYQPSQELD